jgi:hypothetical protein
MNGKIRLRVEQIGPALPFGAAPALAPETKAMNDMCQRPSTILSPRERR